MESHPSKEDVSNTNTSVQNIPVPITDNMLLQKNIVKNQKHFFPVNMKQVSEVIKEGEKQFDPMWRLPLFSLYREFLNSPIADINNNSTEPYGGAITAALFLKEFVGDDIPWLHFDMMAWNLRNRPGRPLGGEAMALRALFSYLCKRFT